MNKRKTNPAPSQVSVLALLPVFCFLAIGIKVQAGTDYDYWKSWEYGHLYQLDGWGETVEEKSDILALYKKETGSTFEFRIDLMNFTESDEPQVLLVLGWNDTGATTLPDGLSSSHTDFPWQVVISISSTTTAADYLGQSLDSAVISSRSDWRLDTLSVALDKSVFAEIPLESIKMQAFSLLTDGLTLSDYSTVPDGSEVNGRGKVVLSFMNAFLNRNPAGINWYDGVSQWSSEERPGEYRGLKYLFDAVEKHETPLTLNDLRMEQLPGAEYSRINDRIRTMHAKGLIDPLMSLTYGHFMCWQPDSVDQKAIELERELRSRMQLPVSDVFYPYEVMITPNDIEIIKTNGYKAIYGLDQYLYWMGFITDWSDEAWVESVVEGSKKVHSINGMDFYFTPNYGGFIWDERWGDIDWDNYSQREQYKGTDSGLDIWWRRILFDMAMDADQEKFLTIGTDIGLTDWFFEDIADQNLGWLANHPWIEVVTFSELSSRNWTPIDHGYLDPVGDELLIQHTYPGNGHYNAYFPLFYYGGIADGHTYFIDSGETVEAYFDYVPYYKDGQVIPSGTKMGDWKSPGTIVYETINNLQQYDNAIADIAWLAYFSSIGEQTVHSVNFYTGDEGINHDDLGGKYLHPRSRVTANSMLQVRKLCRAAQWFEEAGQNLISTSTVTDEADLDFDGEMEYLIYNNRLFLILENEGGRVEYAFALDTEDKPVQFIAPHNQQYGGWGENYEAGELTWMTTYSGNTEMGFLDDHDNDGHYDLGEYAFTLTNDSIVCTSPDGQLEKTFTLSGSDIQVHYESSGTQGFSVDTGLCVDFMGMYAKDWSDYYIPASYNSRQNRGWLNSSGHVVNVVVDGINCETNSTVSFNDSPVRQLPKEPETDPVQGYWMHYPNHIISLNGHDEFTIILSVDSPGSFLQKQYNYWKEINFQNEPVPAQSQEDLDKDGLPNILEFSLDGNDPTTADNALFQYFNQALNRLEIPLANGIDPRNLILEISEDLINWQQMNVHSGFDIYNQQSVLYFELKENPEPAKFFFRLNLRQ